MFTQLERPQSHNNNCTRPQNLLKTQLERPQSHTTIAPNVLVFDTTHCKSSTQPSTIFSQNPPASRARNHPNCSRGTNPSLRSLGEVVVVLGLWPVVESAVEMERGVGGASRRMHGNGGGGASGVVMAVVVVLETAVVVQTHWHAKRLAVTTTHRVRTWPAKMQMVFVVVVGRRCHQCRRCGGGPNVALAIANPVAVVASHQDCTP